MHPPVQVRMREKDIEAKGMNAGDDVGLWAGGAGPERDSRQMAHIAEGSESRQLA